MIYTCYDMVRDCRADRPEGWSYFVTNYVPVVRRLLAHYAPASGEALLKDILLALRRPDSSLFTSVEPAPERWFLAELRQQVLAAVPDAGPADGTIDLEILTAALDPLTPVEKRTVWLETMHYAPEHTGTLLRMDPRTVEKIRLKAAEAIRGKVDTWSRDLLAKNGRALGRAAADARTAECLPPKAFLDMLDGRTTWGGREEVDRHISACWHCVDHFCRMAEVIDLLRQVTPLSEAEAEPFRALLGLKPQKQPVWKRLSKLIPDR